MSNHDDLERRLRDLLREALDAELGPDPTWVDSSAARRVAEAEQQARRRRPLRVLGIAALIGLAGGAAMLGGWPDRPSDPDPSPPAQIDLPSSDGWIAFSASDGDPATNPDTDIWFVGLDREPRRAVGTDTDTVGQFCPAFSPDGRGLAYARSEGATSALAIADIDDRGAVTDRLEIPLGQGSPPPCALWSPDGTRLAFPVPLTSPTNPGRSAEGSEVWVVRVDDRSITALPNLLASDLEWSPDGNVLAIASGDEALVAGEALQDSRIHLYELASGETRTLDETLGANTLTWSPDGQQIAYVAFDSVTELNETRVQLRVVDVVTGQPKAMSNPFGLLHGIGPVWSPDGDTIAYQRICEASLYDDSAGRWNPTDPRHACSAEGHEIVLVDAHDLSRPDERADDVVIATFQTADGPERPFWPYRATWSPDGAYLLCMAWGGALLPDDYSEFLVAVPTDPDGPAVLLYEPPAGGLEAYEGYDETIYQPIQTWAVPSE